MTTINGLPAHVLLIHIVVIVLPLASALAVIGSLWPKAQRKLTFLTPLAALAGMAAVPFTTATGAQLAQRLGNPAFIAEHMRLGLQVLPWAVSLFLVTAGQWAYLAYAPRRRWVTVLLSVAAVVSAIGTTVMVALTGDAGAHAVWGGLAAR
ncbi:hypothetical protein GCM10009841_01960 [Microlunatus panaciterrae]|uniref:Uncharacterized BrkB/YihY/UPF0761 family membrane protein n=1 Tax=Microlunatus panaciterrae TaxID=400768 RepID=A0ABS2RJX2_9ACTN|nr:hypothetical protein [Microlunatus panaciterrae]MBM7799277.1 uncharacterized BrkB/YihY/UPF0761 family membrane protein [Microlunatus panaciterrae]